MHRDNLTRSALHFTHVSIVDQLNAFFREHCNDRLRDVVIFVVEQARVAFDDGDATAEAAKCLSEFEADVASTKDQEVFRNAVKFQGLDVGERLGFAKTRNRWDCGA